MAEAFGGPFCRGDQVILDGTLTRYIRDGFFTESTGVGSYVLVTGNDITEDSETRFGDVRLTLVERGQGPRFTRGDVARRISVGDVSDLTDLHLAVQSGLRVWGWSFQPAAGGDRVPALETDLELSPGGGQPPLPPLCEAITPVTCSLVERDSLGSGVVLSGVTTPVGFFELVELVATIEDDPLQVAAVTWQASHGDIIAQSYNTATWLSPNFETPAIVSVFINGQIEIACSSTFQTPPVPIGTPGLVSALHIEEAPRFSGRIFSGVMTNIEPGQTVDLVATILNDDLRRNNIQWSAQRGTIDSEQWNLATYTAPAGAGVDVVDIFIDSAVQFQARCLFSIPSAPLPDIDLTQLEDFLHVDFWKTLAYRLSQGVAQTEEGIPNDIKSARDFLAGLAQQAGDDVLGVPAQVKDLLDPEFQTTSFNILSGMEAVMEPIFGAAFNPIQTAIQALPIPTPAELWQAFWDGVEEFFSPAIRTGVNLFLEGLEQSFALIGAPLWARLLEVPDLPVWITSLIEQLANPTEQAAALLGQAASGAAVSGSITGIIAPALRAIEQDANRRGPNVPLDVGSTIAAFVRGFSDLQGLVENMARHGFSDDPVDVLVSLAIPRLDVNAVNLQVLRFEMQQSAASAGPRGCS